MANLDPLVDDPSTEIIFGVSEDEVDGVTRQVRLGAKRKAKHARQI